MWTKRALWPVLLRWLGAGIVVAGLVNVFTPAQFESSVMTYILPAGGVTRSAEAYQRAMFIDARLDSYARISHSEPVLDAVAAELGLDYGSDRLAEQTTVRPLEGTGLLVFSARDRDPAQAQRLAASLAGQAVQALERVEKGSATASSIEFQWVSPADYPTTPVGPRRLVTLALGSGVGLALGLLFVVLPWLQAVSYRNGRVHIVVVGQLARTVGRGGGTSLPTTGRSIGAIGAPALELVSVPAGLPRTVPNQRPGGEDG